MCQNLPEEMEAKEKGFSEITRFCTDQDFLFDLLKHIPV